MRKFFIDFFFFYSNNIIKNNNVLFKHTGVKKKSIPRNRWFETLFHPKNTESPSTKLLSKKSFPVLGSRFVDGQVSFRPTFLSFFLLHGSTHYFSLVHTLFLHTHSLGKRHRFVHAGTHSSFPFPFVLCTLSVLVPFLCQGTRAAHTIVTRRTLGAITTTKITILHARWTIQASSTFVSISSVSRV